MKALMMATMATLMMAAPLFAQESGRPEARAYVSGLGGFASTIGHTTGDLRLEGGVRVAPHVKLFADVGRFGNLQGELQPTLNAATADLAATRGLDVVGSGRLPATYGQAGVRVEVPTRSRVLPYVMGAIGAAHLSPKPTFAFTDGILPDGSTPPAGTEVTTAITSAGLFTSPSPSTSAMVTLGGGVELPLASHWIADAGYRFSRLNADTALSATPIKTNGMTFGVGYRF